MCMRNFDEIWKTFRRNSLQHAHRHIYSDFKLILFTVKGTSYPPLIGFKIIQSRNSWFHRWMTTCLGREVGLCIHRGIFRMTDFERQTRYVATPPTPCSLSNKQLCCESMFSVPVLLLQRKHRNQMLVPLVRRDPYISSVLSFPRLLFVWREQNFWCDQTRSGNTYGAPFASLSKSTLFWFWRCENHKRNALTEPFNNRYEKCTCLTKFDLRVKLISLDWHAQHGLLVLQCAFKFIFCSIFYEQFVLEHRLLLDNSLKSSGPRKSWLLLP